MKEQSITPIWGEVDAIAAAIKPAFK
jgi:hypothetical protein